MADSPELKLLQAQRKAESYAELSESSLQVTSFPAAEGYARLARFWQRERDFWAKEVEPARREAKAKQVQLAMKGDLGESNTR